MAYHLDVNKIKALEEYMNSLDIRQNELYLSEDFSTSKKKRKEYEENSLIIDRLSVFFDITLSE